MEELKLSAFAESFEKQLKVYDEVLVLERGNVLSLKLTDADKKRDDAYRALAGIVKTYTVFPEEEKADAALKLLHVIGKYGKGSTVCLICRNRVFWRICFRTSNLLKIKPCCPCYIWMNG